MTAIRLLLIMTTSTLVCAFPDCSGVGEKRDIRDQGCGGEAFCAEG